MLLWVHGLVAETRTPRATLTTLTMATPADLLTAPASLRTIARSDATLTVLPLAALRVCAAPLVAAVFTRSAIVRYASALARVTESTVTAAAGGVIFCAPYV